jgi:hypothetical protein
VRRRLPRLLTLLLALAVGGLAADARAQVPAPSGAAPAPPRLGPLLPAEHWAVEAVGRLDRLLLLEDHLPAQGAVPLEVLETALRAAASSGDSRAAQRAAAWHRRLLAEFPGLAAERGAGAVLLGASAGAGARGRAGAAAPGLGEIEPHRSGALPLDDRLEPLLLGSLSGSLGGVLAFEAVPLLTSGGVELERGGVRAGLGPFALSVGRIPVGYGPGEMGAVTLGGSVPLDAVQLGTARALRLPGAFGWLGPVSGHTFFARMKEERHLGDPYFWGGSVQLRPHRRVTLGVHRAALFGGDNPEEQPVTLRRIGDMLLGRVAGVGFEDQVVSVSLRYLLPTEALLPLTAYVEWGAEDAAGAWRDVPGQVFGLSTPALPALPELSMGVELARFGTSCCGNPEWYRHWSFHGSWASRDEPLAHPLGGDGRELSTFATFLAADGGLRLRGKGFLRDRGEQNLYSPERLGRSVGGGLGVEWWIAPRTSASLTGRLEHGGDYTEQIARLGVRLHF